MRCMRFKDVLFPWYFSPSKITVRPLFVIVGQLFRKTIMGKAGYVKIFRCGQIFLTLKDFKFPFTYNFARFARTSTQHTFNVS